MATALKDRGWLILSRAVEEEIVIGTAAGEVVIKVIELREDKVRLAIDAPRCVPVDRREVYEAKKRSLESTQANSTKPNKDAAKDSAIATEGVF